MHVFALVHGRGAKPVSNAVVRVWNSSGFGQSTTDLNGVALLSLSETEMLAISVNGVLVYTNAFGYWVNYNNIGLGIIADIHLKR